MRKLFLVLSLAIISAMALGACASGNVTGTPGATSGVPGTGATSAATVSGATSAVTGTVVAGTSQATVAVSGTPAVTGSVAATTAGTAAATGAAGTPTPSGNGATVFRLSNVLGAKVVASNVTVSSPDDIKDNQVLGTIDSVLVDPHTGQMVYVLLTPGEAVPDAPKGLIAVPYKALKIAPRSSSSGSTFNNDYHDYFTTEMTAQDFQKAPVVDTEKTQFGTPNFDTAWRSYWSGLNFQVPAIGQNGVIRLNTAENVFPEADVVGKDGSDVGNVANFLLDPTQGTLDYLVVSDGGFLGLGESYTPVPWKNVTYNANPQHFVVDTTAVDFSQAPQFASLNDMNTLGSDWEQKIITFWSNPPTPPAPTSAAGTTAATVAATPAATATP